MISALLQAGNKAYAFPHTTVSQSLVWAPGYLPGTYLASFLLSEPLETAPCLPLKALSEPLLEFGPESESPKLSGERGADPTSNVYAYHCGLADDTPLVVGVGLPLRVKLRSRSQAAPPSKHVQPSKYLSFL